MKPALALILAQLLLVLALVAWVPWVPSGPARAGDRVRVSSADDAAYVIPEGHRLVLESATRVDGGGTRRIALLVDGKPYARVILSRRGSTDLSGLFVRGGALQAVQGRGRGGAVAVYGRLESR